MNSPVVHLPKMVPLVLTHSHLSWMCGNGGLLWPMFFALANLFNAVRSRFPAVRSESSEHPACTDMGPATCVVSSCFPLRQTKTEPPKPIHLQRLSGARAEDRCWGELFRLSRGKDRPAWQGGSPLLGSCTWLLLGSFFFSIVAYLLWFSG